MKKLYTLLLLSILFSCSHLSAQTVYVTKSGKKYHTENCRYVSNSANPIDLSDAIDKGYTACSVCKPSPNNSGNSIESKTETGAEGKINSTSQQSKSVQCSAMTKKGKQCKRMTKSSNGKCWQHGGD
ncbi:MAG: hypothetical protein M3R36_06005 [Bacteroidota bacterium]|nr:hypothetical protein [Bacteroidota bacterium]